MADVVLLGASGLAREVMSSLIASGRHHVVGLLDDNPDLAGQRVRGVEVLGGFARAAELDAQLVCCVGSGKGRRAVTGRLADLGIGPDRYATVIDPSTTVTDDSRVGPGSILLGQCVLTAEVSVGAHVVAMPHVVLTHDDVVEDCATLCAGVVLGGTVHVGSGAYLGMSSSVRQNVHIGADSTLGMGAVLLEDLPAGQVWAGCPARPLAPRRGAPDPSPHHTHDQRGL